jgi:hypothetical protein
VPASRGAAIRTATMAEDNARVVQRMFDEPINQGKVELGAPA